VNKTLENIGIAAFVLLLCIAFFSIFGAFIYKIVELIIKNEISSEKVTLLVAIITAGITMWKYTDEKKKEREERFFERRREAYQSFLYSHLDSIRFIENKNRTLIEGQKNWDTFQKELLIWGSDALINKINKLRYANNDSEVYKNYGDVVIQIRKDLGLKDEKSLFWSDIWKICLSPKQWEEVQKDIRQKESKTNKKKGKKAIKQFHKGWLRTERLKAKKNDIARI